MAHGASCKCSSCGRRGAAQACAWSIRILRHMVKPGRLGKAAREKAGLDRKGHRKPTSEEKDAQHALADEVYEEEVVPLAENEGVMDCEDIFTDLAAAITPVGDGSWSPEEAARNAELALEEAEMAAAEAESFAMELETLLKDLGV
ncbi:TY5A [Symbiodinium necroappetens]|uniref:TY5A protein n=1 Tax=Symbiodinium necroappetens TaxID=1628268 RepID=A0A813C8U0_9DINO|nr:TY5A [Symbiodinium necroappetens]